MNKNTAILVIDMQDFFLKDFLPSVKRELISNQQKIIHTAHKKKIPFVVIEYKCRGIFRGHTTKTLQDKLKSGIKQILIKESNSGFTKTELNKILKDLKVKTLILIGANANACVQDTAIGAIKRGYKVVTGKGVIASSSRKDMDLSAKNKRWFKQNTTFFDSPEKLLSHLN